MKRCSLIVGCLMVGGLAGSFLVGPLLKGQAPGGAAIPKEMTSYRDMVKRVLPAVVSIESTVKAAPVNQRRRAVSGCRPTISSAIRSLPRTSG